MLWHQSLKSIHYRTLLIFQNKKNNRFEGQNMGGDKRHVGHPPSPSPQDLCPCVYIYCTSTYTVRLHILYVYILYVYIRSVRSASVVAQECVGKYC